MRSRFVRSLTGLLIASLLAQVFAGSALLAQSGGTPSASEQSDGLRTGLPDGPEFIQADGVTSVVLAEVQADALADASTLLLDELTIPPSDSLAAHTSTSAEILLVRDGVMTITDSFGFSAATPAGQALTFAPGSTYELANNGADPVTVLRLAISGGEGASADSEASPAAFDSVPLIAQPIEGLDGPVTLFLANAVFEPGASSGHLAHDGPLGLVIEAGTLDVLSPSGLTGQLQEGTAVVLPVTAPLVASNSGATDAVVLFAGVVSAGVSLVSEVSPTPVPTGIPTLEPTAAATEEPTAAATEPPTPAQEPTATPEPELSDLAIVQMGESIEVDGATLNVSIGDIQSAGVRISFTYTNTSEDRLDFVVPEGYLDVHDDLGVTWSPRAGLALTGQRVILEPGDAFTGWWRFSPDGERDAAKSYTANVFVTFRDFGGIPMATWGFTVANGKILTIPADAVDPASAFATPIASPLATPVRSVAGTRVPDR